MNAAEPERIRHISSPAPVNLDDSWYELATLDHFWIQRRFEVLTRLASQPIQNANAIAEVGCGQGLLQRQLEDRYRVAVSGFDLNQEALKRTASRNSAVFCYNVLERKPEYKARFDVILLFDVLEHLEDEDEFVKGVQFHLAPKGKLIINVPAFQVFFSNYDRAVGHVRRYDVRALRGVSARNGMFMRQWSYWGLPLIPLVALRKIWTPQKNGDTTRAGFDNRGHLVNNVLLLLSRLETIPQHLLGTSLMAVLENRIEETVTGVESA